MRCPRCNAGDFTPNHACPNCQFQGDPVWLESLNQVRFLLGELESWAEIPNSYRQELRRRYTQQERQLEIELGLRSGPLQGEALEATRLELAMQHGLRQALRLWVLGNIIRPEAARPLDQQFAARQAELEQQLADAPSTPWGAGHDYSLALRQAQMAMLRQFAAEKLVYKERAYQNEIVQLERDIARLSAWLRQQEPPPAPEQAAPHPAAGQQPPTEQRPAAQPAPGQVPGTRPPEAQPAAPPRGSPQPAPRPARQPLTWERVIETLLSERTLNALLFLGAGLLFAAAVSLVVWNWQAFPPWLQVTFLASFTGVFYGLGWYVRSKMHLPDSGLALSAVASLLVPLDFYAFYLSGGFPVERWPEVWLLASIVCLGAYLLTSYRLQAEFFGYLVALAAGSLVASALQVAGVHAAWQATALCGVGLGLAQATRYLPNYPRWRILVRPFWQTALLGSGVILILALSQRLLGPPVDPPTRLAHALDAWICGITFLLGALRQQSRPLVAVTALSFPLAVLLTQNVALVRWGLPSAWQAPGLAGLALLYLWAGQRWRRRPAGSLPYHAGGVVLPLGVLLASAAGVWAARQASTVAVTYPFLATAALLVARLRRQPGWLYLSSLFLAVAASGWVAALDGSTSQISLAWAGLAILHVAAALWISTRLPGQAAGGQPDQGRMPSGYFDTPLYISGWLLGGLATAAALAVNERGLLAYTLGNWAGLNLWLAWLVHPLARNRSGEAPAGLAAVVIAWQGKHRTGPWRIPTAFFHLWASHLLIAAFFCAWTSRQPADIYLGLGLTGVAWLFLLVMAWAQGEAAQYQAPWHLAAQVAAGLALFYSVWDYTDGWSALALLLLAGFYFTIAFLARRPSWLMAGGGLAPLGALAGLDWLGVKAEPRYLIIAGLPLVYELWAAWLGAARRDGPRTRQAMYPWHAGPARLPAYRQALHRITQVAGTAILVTGLFWLLETGTDDPTALWIAPGIGLLALMLAVHAWLAHNRTSAHLAAWLLALAGAITASHFSHGTGRSALLAALLATAYILGERLLYRFAHRPARFLPGPARISVRQAVSIWQMYARPLEYAGWGVAVLTVWLALVRNLIILGDGAVRERWSAGALAVLVGLFAGGIFLYQQKPQKAQRLAWIASGLAFAPWTLATLQLWRAHRITIAGYGTAWSVLALLLLYSGFRLGPNRRASLPPQYVGQGMLPLAALWASNDTKAASAAFGLALLFYSSALAYDLRNNLRSPRFLYPALFVLPLWAAVLLNRAAPFAPETLLGALLLLFPLPALWLGYRIEQRSQPQASRPVPLRHLPRLVADTRFRLPFSFLAYGTLFFGCLAMLSEPSALVVALLFAAGILALSAILFCNMAWIYLAAAVFPMAVWVTLSLRDASIEHYGWGLLGCAGLYLAIAYLLNRYPAGLRGEQSDGRPAAVAHKISTALLAPIFVLTYIALPFTSLERTPAQIGYSAAALLCVLIAVWQRWPLLLGPAGGLALVPYWVSLLNLGMQPVDYGLGLWPAITAMLGLAYLLDHAAGRRLFAPGEPPAGWARWLRWWALPLFFLAYGLAAAGVVLSLPYANRLPLALSLAALAYGLATAYFRSPTWLLASAGTAQLAALACFRWWGLSSGRPWGTWLALAFAPVMWLTALAGLAVERRLREGAPLATRSSLRVAHPSKLLQAVLSPGWSRPLYLLTLIDLLWSQATGLHLAQESPWISLSNAVVTGLFAGAWQVGWLTYVPLALGVWALAQQLAWLHAPTGDLGPNLALLTLGYGLSGYLIRLLREPHSQASGPAGDSGAPSADTAPAIQNDPPGKPRFFYLWEPALIQSAWLLSLAALGYGLLSNLGVLKLAVRVALGFPLVAPQDLPAVQRLVSVLALLGLFYLAAAVVGRRLRLGYAAIALLLGAWSLELLLAWGLREVQYYAIPAGVYLLGVGYVERRSGSRGLAGWVDRAAVLLLLGSSFWQSQGEAGGRYALLMGVESLLLVWWGSARRLRRFLYAGVIGLTLDVAAQLIEPLLSANRWIVFAVAGLLLVGLAVMIERRLETLKTLSEDLRSRLETWE